MPAGALRKSHQGWGGWEWTPWADSQWHQQSFSTRESRRAVGQQGEEEYPWQQLATEEEERQAERETPCLLARLPIHTSHIQSLIRTTRVGLALAGWSPGTGAALLGGRGSALAQLASLSLCYFHSWGHSLHTDSCWVSVVWPSQHLKTFSMCCQLLKNRAIFTLNLQIGDIS